MVRSSIADVNAAVVAASSASETYGALLPQRRAEFLRAIADKIEAGRDTIVPVAMRESNLPEARLVGETGRTTGQLRFFAGILEEGSYQDVRIDVGDAERKPLPKPDLRSMNVPIGPVAVFGASNFPLAFSVAGGDTASALAAGCPVIVCLVTAAYSPNIGLIGYSDADVPGQSVPKLSTAPLA